MHKASGCRATSAAPTCNPDYGHIGNKYAFAAKPVRGDATQRADQEIPLQQGQRDPECNNENSVEQGAPLAMNQKAQCLQVIDALSSASKTNDAIGGFITFSRGC